MSRNVVTISDCEAVAPAEEHVSLPGDGAHLLPLVRDVDLHALQRVNPDRYPFLLQSSASSGDLGRYDILFAFPGESLELTQSGQLIGPHRTEETRFLNALDAWWRREQQANSICSTSSMTHSGVTTQLPFTGGWFLYLGYELAAEIEPSLDLEADPLLPAAFAVRCPAAVLRDHQSGECFFVAEDDTAEFCDIVLDDLSVCGIRDDDNAPELAGPETDEEPELAFIDAVLRAKVRIAAGDVYQANLSREWSLTVDDRLDADRIYSALCAANPAPFAGLVRWRDTAIISSSPERLLCSRDGIVSTRPIAGTRPRSVDSDVDNGLSIELFASAKERAEHVMLIDLERNDLGRICEPGSVEVDEMMVLESYAHVHHIVSNVRGKLRAEISPGDTIRAMFPGGTITGCPKVRCMQIVNELEASPRGAYTGSFGYLNRDGSMDINILIRTMIMQGSRVRFRAGSGIVADSDPQAELAETRAKAKGMLEALIA